MSSTDDSLRTKFVTSIRAKNFPMFGTMYHPEYQMLNFVDKEGNKLPKDVWNLAKGPETALIAHSISNCFAKKCLKRKSIKQDLRSALSQTEVVGHVQLSSESFS